MSQFAYILFDSKITIFLHKYFRDLCIDFHANKQMVFSWYQISNQSPTLVFFFMGNTRNMPLPNPVWRMLVGLISVCLQARDLPGQLPTWREVRSHIAWGHHHCVNIRHEIFSQSFQAFFYFVLVVSYNDELCDICINKICLTGTGSITCGTQNDTEGPIGWYQKIVNHLHISRKVLNVDMCKITYCLPVTMQTKSDKLSH